MVQLLTRGERKTRRKNAFRFVSISFLIFLAVIWAGMFWQSFSRQNEKAAISDKKGPGKFRFEFRQVKDSDKVDLYINGKFFTAYCYNEHLKKPILFPVLTASGKTVTRGYPLAPRPFEPVDHPHHYGISFTYGDVNGLDFWSNTDSVQGDMKMHYGTIVQESFDEISSGNDKGVLKVTCAWNRPDGRTLLDEHTTFVFRADSDMRIIDRTTTLTAEDLGVQFQDTKEGMYAMRVAREMEQPSDEPQVYLDQDLRRIKKPEVYKTNVHGLYLNSNGLTGDAVWGKRAKWVMLSSEINKEPVSIIMFDHPGNPNYPAFWHARGYGLFAVNPFGSNAFTNGEESLNFFLASGNSVTFRYRIAVINGYKPDNADIEKLFDEFAREK